MGSYFRPPLDCTVADLPGVCVYNYCPLISCAADAEILSEAVSVLRDVISADIPEPEEILVYRWSEDPLFYGSSSIWPSG